MLLPLVEAGIFWCGTGRSKSEVATYLILVLTADSSPWVHTAPEPRGWSTLAMERLSTAKRASRSHGTSLMAASHENLAKQSAHRRVQHGRPEGRREGHESCFWHLYCTLVVTITDKSKTLWERQADSGFGDRVTLRARSLRRSFTGAAQKQARAESGRD